MKTYCSKEGKEVFATRDDAHKALISMTKSHKACGAVYQCDECGGYHVTHFSYRRSKDIRTRKARKVAEKRQDNDGQDNK